MNLTELLVVLRERRIELRAEGDRLRCIAEPGALTPELSDGLRTHKSELLELLRGAMAQPAASAQHTRAERRDRYPLSPTQNRAAVTAREGAILPTAFRLRGPLDRSALLGALEQIVARHAPLRSAFHLDQEPPEQSVLPAVVVALGDSDISALAGAEQAARLRLLLDEQCASRFDVAHPPLFHFHLIRLAELEHVLFVAFSPLVFDGWSFDVFWNELRLGYAAMTAGRPWPLPALPIEYVDYVAERQHALEQREPMLREFWRKRLDEELPALPLPTDRPRPRTTSSRGGHLAFELPALTVHDLRGFAQTAAVTPQMIMLAALYSLLHRLGGASRIVVGTPVEGRPHASMETLIGPFVNMLLLPMRVDARVPFIDFVRAVRDECLTAYDHQDYPIEWLRVRSPPSPGGVVTPAFQVEFSFQQVSQRGTHMGPLALSQLELESGAATNDLTLWVKDWGERIAGAVEFKTDVFDQATIAHWFECYTHYLAELVRTPERPMLDLDLLSPARDAVETAAARAAAALPEFVLRELPQPAAGAPVQLRVVDERGRLRPLAAVGSLELVVAGMLHRTGLLVRLSHDGQLLPVEARASVPPPRRRSREPPRTDLEGEMTRLFADMLGLEDVGVSDDFFELGGNSLIAVRLFGEVHRLFGVRLPATTILEANTPRRLAQLVSERFPNRERCLVKLRAGSGERSLFLVHDADGETLLYLPLARRMPDSLTVFGIEPLRQGRIAMVHTTLQEAAAHYIEEMRKQQPKGPYYVGGLCAGGLIAFEIARQLAASGEQVGAVVFIDAAPPTAKKAATEHRRRLESLSETLSDVHFDNAVAVGAAMLRKVGRAFEFEAKHRVERAGALALVALQRHLCRSGRPWPDGLPAASAREVFVQAEAAYRVRLLSGVDAVLVRATEAAAGERERSGNSDVPYRELLSEPDFGWSRWLDRPLEIIDVPGGHSTSLREPHVAFVADQLRRVIQEAELRFQGSPAPEHESELRHARA